MTAPMRALADTAGLAGVDRADVPERFRTILAQGWEREDDGAWVLRGLRASYHGRRATFTDVTSWEAAVNGRPIPDLDLPDDHPDRPGTILRRGYAIAHEALALLEKLPSPPRVTGYVQVARTLTDNPTWVGSVTFWSDHAEETPYVTIEDLPEDALALFLNNR